MTQKKIHRARKPKAGRLNPAHSLLSALKFVAMAQKKTGLSHQQFCKISNNRIVASDGILTIGVKIEEELEARPHTYQFIDALSKVEDDLSITQISSLNIAVVSNAFRAVIPCDAYNAKELSPDDKLVSIDNRLKDAFQFTVCLTNEGAKYAHLAGILVQYGSAVSTNSHAIIEYWHGLDLPTMLVPKVAATAVLKSGKDLSGFGYSGDSATFWFTDDSFIKTQLFQEKFPAYKHIFECQNINAWHLPDDFYKAVRTIESFSKSGIVYFKEGRIASDDMEQASTYEVEGLPEGMGFNSNYLLLIKDSVEKVHFDKSSNKLLFFSNNTRGVLMGIDYSKEVKYNYESEETIIPF